MDLGSPLAIIVTVGVVVFGIIMLGGEIGDFINLPSVMLTVIPTFGALFIAFPTGQLFKVVKHFGIIVGRQKFDPLEYVSLVVGISEKAREQGLLALEAEAGRASDNFVRSAALMIADATDPDTVGDRLYGILESITMRHAQAWSIYEKGAAFAPAFGMVATLVSLVNMLMNLNFEDAGGVASLGINMSAALITTFYGSLMANVFFIPLGNKLRIRHQKEIDCKKIVIEGFLAIQKGMSPKAIREMLLERIDPKTAARMSN